MSSLSVASTISPVLHETRRAATLFGGWIPAFVANPKIGQHVRAEAALNEVPGFAPAMMEHGEMDMGPRNDAPGRTLRAVFDESGGVGLGPENLDESGTSLSVGADIQFP